MDKNDCAPVFSSSLYELTVAENSDKDSTICVLSATDQDDGNNGQVSIY